MTIYPTPASPVQSVKAPWTVTARARVAVRTGRIVSCETRVSTCRSTLHSFRRWGTAIPNLGVTAEPVAARGVADRLRDLASEIERQPELRSLPFLSRAGQGFILATPGQSLIALNYTLGLAYLELLLSSGRDWSCAELIETVKGVSLSGTSGQASEPVVDRKAARDYHKAVAILEQRQADGDDSAQTADRLSWLHRQLHAAGRREHSGDARRQFHQVRKALREALAVIGVFGGTSARTSIHLHTGHRCYATADVAQCYAASVATVM